VTDSHCGRNPAVVHMSEEDGYLQEVVELIAQGIAAGKSMEANQLKARTFKIPDDIFELARVRYETAVGIIRAIRDPAALMSDLTRQTSWYEGPKATDKYWPIVRDRLADTLRSEALDSVDKASSKILSVMRPPGIVEFSTRGLVLGYVQSGKTTSFISVIAKAADRGYRVFIVLSGITDNLRSQTQSRVDDLLRSDSQSWYQLTTSDSDFAESPDNAATLLASPDIRFIAVVKKNPARLRKLRDWLKGAGRTILAGAPILLIDDEADQASIDVSSAVGRTSRINGLLKQILEQPKAAYVAYTATPFANLLIDPNVPGDLYPADFIVPLPESDDYFGAKRMFGTSERLTEDQPISDGMDVFRSVALEEADVVRPPKGRGAVYSWDPAVGPALGESLRWFLLSTAARRIRGKGNPHATMLVHTSMLAEAHKRLAAAVETELRRISELLLNQDELEWSRFRSLYNAETLRVGAEEFGHSPVPFDHLTGKLTETADETKVIIDNYLSQDRLIYKKDQPSTTVVVGGNTLSRGLTLEGLTSSYFVRSASAYDTLLQMGRWFGYRHGYEDLCRVWMTEELHGWFRDLSLVEAEIRSEIVKYELEAISPSDVAVRIRTHPDMSITAAAKMRNAVTAEMSFSATRPQTILFESQNYGWLSDNLEAVRWLSENAAVTGRIERTYPSGRRGFAGLDASDILTFLTKYHFHQDSTTLRRNYLSDYIHKENSAEALLKWNVVFMENPNAEGRTVDLGLTSGLAPLQRSRLVGSKDGVANLKAIASTMDRASDLELDPREVRRQALLSGSAITDAALLQIRQRELPDRGLLCIYPIDKDSVPTRPSEKNLRTDLDAVDDLVGLTFFFPRARGAHSDVSYMSADLRSELNEDLDEEIAQATAADSADSLRLEEGI
jgi:hypothetical protein